MPHAINQDGMCAKNNNIYICGVNKLLHIVKCSYKFSAYLASHT